MNNTNQFNQYQPRMSKEVLIISLIMLSSVGCSSQEIQASNDVLPSRSQTVGWIEQARIPGVESAVEVKLDTGADTSSINAEILEEPDQETESGGMIRFRFEDGEGNKTIFERPVVRWSRIKSRDGGSIRRPVVRMKFCIANRWVEEEVNLADRDDFDYPILVGRNMLEKSRLVVDSTRTNTVEPVCSEAEAAS